LSARPADALATRSHRKAGFHHGIAQHIVGGVDPHADTIHVAVLTEVGKLVGDAEFATTAAGYRRAIAS
jgi:hypothetical protein